MTDRDRLALSKPLADADVPVADADVPVAEVVSTTRREEARTVMATVAVLCDHGVPIRNIAVVVRDLDTYEEPLYRAAIQYGLPPVFWTQLRVTQTGPYALVESVCEVLGADELSGKMLLRPLEHRWSPLSATTPTWPLDHETIQTAMQALPSGSRSLPDWCDELRTNNEIDDQIKTFVEWLIDCPAPTPNAVTSVLADVVESYENIGLPVTKATDSPALIETEQDARAVVRIKTLVEQIRHKYADRLAEGTLKQSWSDVAELCRLIATQRPGRREHSHALAVDILEANDVWLLDVQYVVAVGLIDGEWPQQTESPVPPELQETILTGEGRTERLAPRTAWTDGRDRDQFDDTFRAARDGLIVTRHTESSEGNNRHRSPLLDYLDVELVPNHEQQRLVSADRELPSAIHPMLTDDARVIDDE